MENYYEKFLVIFGASNKNMYFPFKKSKEISILMHLNIIIFGQCLKKIWDLYVLTFYYISFSFRLVPYYCNEVNQEKERFEGYC